MASFDPIDAFPGDAPPPRPTTPPVRRGFLILFTVLALLTSLVYGVPYVADRAGFAYEAGRSRAAGEALAKLDRNGIIRESSALFRLATARVAPAVVNIRCLKGLAPRPGAEQAPGGQGLVPVGSGSGVIIDKARGFVVTNGHVVQGADEIVVRLSRGGEHRAKLVGADSQTDLAVLQIDADLKVEAAWGDSSKLDVGEWVLAIGSPFMLDQTVTAGIVSATRRNNLPLFNNDAYQDFVQTDAAVNPGNSGGPLIDLKGEVIGINTAIFSPRGQGEESGSVGIGLAISSELAKRVVEQLIATGKVTRGYLGVAINNVDPATVELQKLDDTRGALITAVVPDGPADAAGLKAGDVVLKLGDREIAGGEDLRNRIALLATGAKVPVAIVRSAQPRTIEVTVGAWPVLTSLGLILRDLDKAQLDQFAFVDRPQRAVMIEGVLPHSVAQRANLQPGMRIVGVAGRPVSSRAEAAEAAQSLPADAPVVIKVMGLRGETAEVPLGGPGR